MTQYNPNPKHIDTSQTYINEWTETYALIKYDWIHIQIDTTQRH